MKGKKTHSTLIAEAKTMKLQDPELSLRDIDICYTLKLTDGNIINDILEKHLELIK